MNELDAIRDRLIEAAEEYWYREYFQEHHRNIGEGHKYAEAEAGLAAAITALDEWVRGALIRAGDTALQELCTTDDSSYGCTCDIADAILKREAQTDA